MRKVERAKYGIDAPGIMFGLLGTGSTILACALAVTLALSRWTWALVAGALLAIVGALPFFFGTLMVLYALIGKRRTRDKVIQMLELRGDEHMLDVGAGRGLLTIAAARQLPRGRVTGIDIWNAGDLSGNTVFNAQRNARIERVADRVDFLTQDARALPFADGTFDAVTSLLCLHNIENPKERRAACSEIARVLRAGGRVVVGDYIPTTPYAQAFATAGLRVVSSRPYFATAMSLMWIIEARKPTRQA